MVGPSPTPRYRFAALESWRGLCALSVVLYHLNAATHIHDFTQGSYVAVDFFFVLSGFVLASAYREKVASTGSYIAYVLRRWGRLYPLHLAMLGFYLALEYYSAAQGDPNAFADTRSWPAFYQNLALLQGFTDQALSWNYPSWSVSIELWTSLGFGLILILFRKRATLVCGALALVLAPIVTADLVGQGLIATKSQAETLQTALLCVLEFGLGVLVFDLYARATAGGTRRVGFWVGLLEWPALVIMWASFTWAGQGSVLWTSAGSALVVLIFGFERGVISRLLSLKFPLWLGTISFSIYLTHSLYTEVAGDLVTWLAARLGVEGSVPDGTDAMLTLGGPFAMDTLALLTLGLVILGSGLTYRFIEDPARRAVNTLARRISG